ncbi:DUF6973 domain-containing protein [Peribacillus butanolivorans]|uniref:DUF6973 domain-containing protein n=1 Tax=Peribacillus butanolivorans TaxID=421767 RepID=UPI0007093709|nr:hypothetical protein ASG99_06620 [Bacillus sp. Soil768D1]
MKQMVFAFVCFCILGLTSTIVSANEVEETPNLPNNLGTENKLSDEILNVLTQEDFAKANEILTKNNNIDNLAEEDLDKLIVPILINIANSKDNVIMRLNLLPDAYTKLNAAEKKLAKAHPNQAGIVYNCSGAATGLAGKLYVKGNNDNHNGNAFKHSFWNAAMTRDLGATKAKTWADAHESESKGVSTDMDLKNNKIGRDTYAALNTNIIIKPSYNKIQKELMKKIDQGKLYRVVKGKLVKTDKSGKK